MLSNLNPAVALGAGLLIGAATTYLATREVLKNKYEQIANDEIESVKATYAKRERKVVEEAQAKKPRLTIPYDEAKEAYMAHIEDLGYVPKDPVTITDDKVEFVTPGQIDILTEAERSGVWPGSEVNVLALERDPMIPYPITTDEFLDDLQIEHEKYSLSWYTDTILADDRNEVMEDVDHQVGLENLERFGQGSDGPDTIYVRNERLKVDYEISREDSTYIEVMAGYADNDSVWVHEKAPIKKMRPLSD